MRRFSMTVPTVAFAVSMSGATPVTVAVSVMRAQLQREVDAGRLLHLQFEVAASPVLKPSSSLFTV